MTNHNNKPKAKIKKHELARHYHQLGFMPIPIGIGSKSPTMKWKHLQYSENAVSEQEVVGLWDSRWLRKANIAILLGETSGLFCFDADSAEAWEKACAAFPGNGWKTKSRRGGHIFLATPPGSDNVAVRGNNHITLILPDGTELQGDFKAQGGYVLAPGSQHSEGFYQPFPSNGARLWSADNRKDIPVIDLDTWKIKRKNDNVAYTIRERIAAFRGNRRIHEDDEWTVEATITAPPPQTPEGMDLINRIKKFLKKCPGAVSGEGGDDATFKIACVIVNDFAVDDTDTALHLLSEWNMTCSPPWEMKDLNRFINSAKLSANPAFRGRKLNWKPIFQQGGIIKYLGGMNFNAYGTGVTRIPYDPEKHGPARYNPYLNRNYFPTNKLAVNIELQVGKPAESQVEQKDGKLAGNNEPHRGDENEARPFEERPARCEVHQRQPDEPLREPGEDEEELPEHIKKIPRGTPTAVIEALSKLKKPRVWRKATSLRPKKEIVRKRPPKIAVRFMQQYSYDNTHWKRLLAYLKFASTAQQKVIAQKNLDRAKTGLRRYLNCAECNTVIPCPDGHKTKIPLWCRHTFLCYDCCAAESRWNKAYAEENWKDERYCLLFYTFGKEIDDERDARYIRGTLKKLLEKAGAYNEENRFFIGMKHIAYVCKESVWWKMAHRFLPKHGALFDVNFFPALQTQCRIVSKKEALEFVFDKVWLEPSTVFHGMMTKLGELIDSDDEDEEAIENTASKLINFTFITGGHVKRTSANKAGKTALDLPDRKEIGRMAREAKLKENPEIAKVPSNCCCYVNEEGEPCGKQLLPGSVYYRNHKLCDIPTTLKSYQVGKYITTISDAFSSRMCQPGFTLEAFHAKRKLDEETPTFRHVGNKIILHCRPKNL